MFKLMLFRINTEATGQGVRVERNLLSRAFPIRQYQNVNAPRLSKSDRCPRLTLLFALNSTRSYRTVRCKSLRVKHHKSIGIEEARGLGH